MRSIAVRAGRVGRPAPLPQRRAALPARAARSGLVARRPLHGADRRSARVRHPEDEGSRLQRDPQAREGRAGALVLPRRSPRACSSGRTCPAPTTRAPRREANFQRELTAVIDALRNHPSIVMWVPFNEGWGQHATEKYVGLAQVVRPDAARQQHERLDRREGGRRRRPSRLSRARRCRRSSRLAPRRSASSADWACRPKAHTWLDKGNWGYRSFTSLDEMNAAYRDLLAQLRLHAGDGLTVRDLHADDRRARSRSTA